MTAMKTSRRDCQGNCSGVELNSQVLCLFASLALSFFVEARFVRHNIRQLENKFTYIAVELQVNPLVPFRLPSCFCGTFLRMPANTTTEEGDGSEEARAVGQ